MDLNSLQKELERLVSGLADGNYKEQFKTGFDIISNFKKLGGSQKEAYNKLLPLFNEYQETDEQKAALMGDWLDCICGWVGNKDWYIWREQ